MPSARRDSRSRSKEFAQFGTWSGGRWRLTNSKHPLAVAVSPLGHVPTTVPPQGQVMDARSRQEQHAPPAAMRNAERDQARPAIILAARDDPPPTFAEPRGVLLRELEWLRREGIAETKASLGEQRRGHAPRGFAPSGVMSQARSPPSGGRWRLTSLAAEGATRSEAACPARSVSVSSGKSSAGGPAGIHARTRTPRTRRAQARRVTLSTARFPRRHEG